MTGRAPRIALSAVCLICFFWNLGGTGLFDLDEGLYAECAREMAMTGDFVVPRVNGEPFFEKPPLVYWAAAAFYRVIGRSELATRLPSALATVAVVALVWRFGRRHFGDTAGILAAFFFALSPIVFGAARQLTTDATLDLCIAGSLLAYFHARTSDAPGANRWYLVFWIGMGFGVLAKGLPGVLIPIAAVCANWLFGIKSQTTGDPRPANQSELPQHSMAQKLTPTLVFGPLLFLVIAIPWHVLAHNAAGEAFTSEYIFRQHIARFRGGDTSHLAPFWSYIPGFLLGAFPWSFFVPAALVSRCDSEGGIVRARFRRFLKIWATLVFIMFSASGSKLISYILPMYAPAALLAGDWCARACERKDARRALLVCGISALFLSGTVLSAIVFAEPIIRAIEASSGRPVRMDQIPPGALQWVGHLFAAAVLGTSAYVVLTAARRIKQAFAALCVGMAMFFAVAVFEGLPLIDRAVLKPLREAAGPFSDPGPPFTGHLIVKTGSARRPSFLFYLPDAMVAKMGRAGGVTEARDMDAVAEMMDRDRSAVALVDHASAETLAARIGGRADHVNPHWSIIRPANRR